jgi:alanine dehydrogenase
MIIGIPREIKDHEYRVSLTPDGASTLRHIGHDVWVEASAGEGSGFTDEDYRHAGASIAGSHEEVFDKAELNASYSGPSKPCLPISTSRRFLN